MRIAALAVSAGLAMFVSACATTVPPENALPADPRPVITGGYGGADLSDAGVKAAQAIAVNEIYTRQPTRALVDKVIAETQVVAGLNYRFNITMSGGAAYRVVVYRNLQGEMSVTSFEKLS